MKIAVCDDCHEDAAAVKDILGGHEIRLYYDAESLLADVEQNGFRYNLYLLDIYIEESLNGIELAGRLRRVDERAVLCFISASDGYYREAYDLYAVQYLLKPIREEALKQLLIRVSQSFVRDKEQYISFTWRKQTGTIPYGKILYISSVGRICTIYCKDGSVQDCTGKLSELEQTLDREVFCRCHQSFLVNLYQIQNLNGAELSLPGCRIPISRRYYAEVKRRYQEIVFEEVD